MLGEMKMRAYLRSGASCPRGLRAGGFTLIEFMVVIALVAVLLAVAAPSMREMIDMRRLRAINAQLVTDLQLARSEAIARRTYGRVEFNLDPALPLTCYTIYTADDSLRGCDCNLGPGAACSNNPGAVEIRTVQIPKSLATLISIPGTQSWSIGFEAAMGSLVDLPVDTTPQTLPRFVVDTKIDAARAMRIMLNRSGRPTVCAPTGSRVDVAACP